MHLSKNDLLLALTQEVVIAASIWRKLIDSPNKDLQDSLLLHYGERFPKAFDKESPLYERQRTELSWEVQSDACSKLRSFVEDLTSGVDLELK